MTDNIGYSLGLVEGYLERLVIEGQAGADVALEHFHAVETAYRDERDKKEFYLNQISEINQALVRRR